MAYDTKELLGGRKGTSIAIVAHCTTKRLCHTYAGQVAAQYAYALAPYRSLMRRKISREESITMTVLPLCSISVAIFIKFMRWLLPIGVVAIRIFPAWTA